MIITNTTKQDSLMSWSKSRRLSDAMKASVGHSDLVASSSEAAAPLSDRLRRGCQRCVGDLLSMNS